MDYRLPKGKMMFPNGLLKRSIDGHKYEIIGETVSFVMDDAAAEMVLKHPPYEHRRPSLTRAELLASASSFTTKRI